MALIQGFRRDPQTGLPLAETLSGTALADEIYSDGGGDTLLGLGGADSLFMNRRDNITAYMFGGAGDDNLYWKLGSSGLIDGGEGIDSLDFTDFDNGGGYFSWYSETSFHASLATGTVSSALGGAVQIRNVEVLQGVYSTTPWRGALAMTPCWGMGDSTSCSGAAATTISLSAMARRTGARATTH